MADSCKANTPAVCSHPLLEVASSILVRAVDLENQKRFSESLVCYQESIEIFIKALRSISDWLGGNYHEQISIPEGSTGYGYQRLFGRFLEDGTVSLVWVEDPYIRSSAQNPSEQLSKFNLIKQDLLKHSMTFEWKFSDSLHDREIRFDNGWIVKIGRGLDYVRRSEHKFCGLGVHDYDFRPCSATTIDIFNRSSLLS